MVVFLISHFGVFVSTDLWYWVTFLLTLLAPEWWSRVNLSCGYTLLWFPKGAALQNNNV